MSIMSLLHNSPWGTPGNSNKNKEGERFPGDVYNLFGRKHFKNRDTGGGGDNNMQPPNIKKLLTLAIVVILSGWVLSGVYTVQEEEQAVVLRFGKHTRIANPGLNFHIPSPIEEIIKHKVTRIEREEIGFRSGGGYSQGSLLRNRYSSNSGGGDVADEGLMLTGDENIININFIVQWKIGDIIDYTFNVKSTRDTVREVAESVMREVVGRTDLSDALTGGRSAIELDTKHAMQNMLDFYGTGIEIISIQMLKSDPPTENIIEAFRDVQAANQDYDKSVNLADEYKNTLIPEARARAASLFANAEAYKRSVVDQALGEVHRYKSVYDEYAKAKHVTKKRIYLESMETILSGTEKIIMDEKAGNNILPYLPLKGLKGKSE